MSRIKKFLEDVYNEVSYSVVKEEESLRSLSGGLRCDGCPNINNDCFECDSYVCEEIDKCSPQDFL